MSFSIPSYNAVLSEGCPDVEPLFPSADLQRISVRNIFHIAEHDLSRGIGRTLSPLLADLLEIGIGVLLFDGLSPRYPQEKKFSRDRSKYWQREMRLIVPVRQVDLWQQRA